MIYIDKTQTTVVIPKVSTVTVTELRLMHQTSHKVTTIQVSDQTPNKDYYTFNVGNVFSSLKDGQYDYRVISSGGAAACGIAQVGDYNASVSQHNTSINIKEYHG